MRCGGIYTEGLISHLSVPLTICTSGAFTYTHYLPIINSLYLHMYKVYSGERHESAGGGGPNSLSSGRTRSSSALRIASRRGIRRATGPRIDRTCDSRVSLRRSVTSATLKVNARRLLGSTPRVFSTVPARVPLEKNDDTPLLSIGTASVRDSDRSPADADDDER